MFSLFKLLKQIESHLRIQNKLLGLIAGLTEEDINKLEMNESANAKLIKRPDFSSARVIKLPTEGEIIEEEDKEIANEISTQLEYIEKTGGGSFFEEDDLFGIRDKINEA